MRRQVGGLAPMKQIISSVARFTAWRAWGGRGIAWAMRFAFVLLSLIAMLPIGGCADGVDNASISVAVIGNEKADFAIGRLPLERGAGLLRAATAQGLVSFDAQGRINPGLAERWIASEDGLSYIFRIGDAEWNGGGEVTARQVATILQQRLDELRRGGFGGDLLLIGQVNAITDHVLEIRLTKPRPNLLELLAQPEFGIVKGRAGSGPMRSTDGGATPVLMHRSYNLEDAREELVPPRIMLRGRTAATAIAAYAKGAVDVVEGGRFAHLPLLDAARVDAPAISVDPVVGLFGLSVVNETAFLKEQVNREALAMAMDRTALLAPFERPEWAIAETIWPPDLFGEWTIDPPGWTTATFAERRTEAARRVAIWRDKNGPTPPLRIAMPVEAGGRLLFARIAADLAVIGLEAQRVGPQQDADLRLIDQVADYDGPLWYLTRLSCPATPICNEQADRLVRTALDVETLPDRRRLLRDAAAAIQADGRFIPLAAPYRFSIVRPGVQGHAPNARGWHLLQYLGGGPTS